MAQIIVVSDAQKEIIERLCFALMTEPVQTGEHKVIDFDVQPYTPAQLRGLFNRVNNSMTVPR